MLLIMSLVNLDWNICPELSAPALRGGVEYLCLLNYSHYDKRAITELILPRFLQKKNTSKTFVVRGGSP